MKSPLFSFGFSTMGECNETKKTPQLTPQLTPQARFYNETYRVLHSPIMRKTASYCTHLH